MTTNKIGRFYKKKVRKYSHTPVTFILAKGTLTPLWWWIDHTLTSRVKWLQEVSLDISILQLWPTAKEQSLHFEWQAKWSARVTPRSCLSFHAPLSHGFLPYSPHEELAHRLQGTRSFSASHMVHKHFTGMWTTQWNLKNKKKVTS